MKQNPWEWMFPNITVTEENLYFCIDSLACNYNTYKDYTKTYPSKFPKLEGTVWPTFASGEGVVGMCYYKMEFKNAFTMSCNCSFDWQVNQEKKQGAYFDTAEGNRTLTPYICENVAIAGNGTGDSGTVTSNYPCNVEYGLFDVGTGSYHYEIYVPSTMKHFVFRASTGDGIVANVYYNPTTTKVTGLNDTGSVSINFIKTDPSKLPICN
jgi:hypothetical protein